MATTLNNLGAVLRDLNQLEAARDHYQEAVEIRRQLAEQRPEAVVSVLRELERSPS